MVWLPHEERAEWGGGREPGSQDLEDHDQASGFHFKNTETPLRVRVCAPLCINVSEERLKGTREGVGDDRRPLCFSREKGA